MGQKVNPNSLRFGLNKNWVSRWNAPNSRVCSQWLLEDEAIRVMLRGRCRRMGVVLIEIERHINLNERVNVTIFIHLSQPGLLLTNEREMFLINKELRNILGRNIAFRLEVREVQNMAVSAEIIGQEITDAIQARIPHKLLIKRAMKRAMMAGAKGVKVKVSGRINGVEIARSETYVDGSVPLSTLRADIDYSFQTAKTSYGILGVKVWVHRGLYFGKHFMPLPSAPKGLKFTKEKSSKY